MLLQLLEGMKIALSAIRSNKLRSGLTSLGVIIGIGFVVLMGWFLQGLDTALEQSFSSLGVDVLYVDKFDWAGRKSWREVMGRPDVTLRQGERLMERLTTAQTAAIIARKFNTNIKQGNQTLSSISVVGTNSIYSDIALGVIREGRFFSPVEDMYSANVAVVGYEVAKNLFGEDASCLGKTIKVKGRTFTIIGSIEKQASMFAPPFIDNQVFVPLKSYLNVFGENKSISIAIKAGGTENMDEVRMEAIGLMRQIRNLPPEAEDDFAINETAAFQESVKTLRLSVWGIGIGMTTLSFIVGIIGIMNIMFVSVTERTKEIGIRKALGAQRRAILFQFLVEASALCLLGALVAFAFCSMVMFGVTRMEWASFLSPYIPPQLLLIATVVSIIVGILSGMIPAIRASKLDPVEALRYE
jgi:putative ABC transport system permease protein